MPEIMRLAFKYKLRPTGKQEQAMRNFSGCCRFAYNALPHSFVLTAGYLRLRMSMEDVPLSKHESRAGQLRRVENHRMNTVICTVKLNQFRIKF